MRLHRPLRLIFAAACEFALHRPIHLHVSPALTTGNLHAGALFIAEAPEFTEGRSDELPGLCVSASVCKFDTVGGQE